MLFTTHWVINILYLGFMDVGYGTASVINKDNLFNNIQVTEGFSLSVSIYISVPQVVSLIAAVNPKLMRWDPGWRSGWMFQSPFQVTAMHLPSGLQYRFFEPMPLIWATLWQFWLPTVVYRIHLQYSVINQTTAFKLHFSTLCIWIKHSLVSILG